MRGDPDRPITRLIFLAGHVYAYQAWFEAVGENSSGQVRAAFHHRMLAGVRCDPSVSIWSLTTRSRPLPRDQSLTLEGLAYEHFRDRLGWPVEPHQFRPIDPPAYWP